MQNIYVAAGDRMEHSGYSVDIRAKHEMRSRAVFHHRRRGFSVLRLDSDRSQHLRTGPDIRSDRLAGEEAAGELRRARQGLAHLATAFQVPLVDAQGRERERDLSTCRW